MDYRIGHRLGGLGRGVSSAIRRLQTYASAQKRLPRLKLDSRWRAALSAAGLLLGAGFLAWSASETTYSKALEDWEHRRLPSERVWNHALGSRGWLSPGSPEVIHKALRRLPTALDRAGSVWATSDLEWIVVFTDPAATVPAHVFCRDCKKTPEHWENRGTGWTAFDQVTAELEKTPTSTKTASKHAIIPKYRDSREIQY